VQDLRLEKLAFILTTYSCNIQKGENVLIDLYDSGIELALALVKNIYKVGGYPFVDFTDERLKRCLLLGTNEEHIKLLTEFAVWKMSKMQAYIGIRGFKNITQLSDVKDNKMLLYTSIYNQKVHSQLRVKKTKWVVLRYPNNSMAQLAGMSLEAFEDFYFKVCTLDYSKMSKLMDPLVERMQNACDVYIKGQGTDLKFSIKDIPVVKCAGVFNIPDGEVFTAPVKDSVNGVVTFNCPTVYQGTVFENVKLKFKDGRIVEATSSNTQRLNAILDTDEGARYIGEFSLGLNPFINFPLKDILFDEKINGSFHLTPGQAYETADNGNRSSIHWDMVCIQRKEYGGGEIYFDGELIRKDGDFVPEDLQVLNSANWHM